MHIMKKSLACPQSTVNSAYGIQQKMSLRCTRGPGLSKDQASGWGINIKADATILGLHLVNLAHKNGFW